VPDDKNYWDSARKPAAHRKPKLRVVVPPNGHEGDGLPSDGGWFTRLQKNQDGAFLPTVANAMTILAHDQALAGLLFYNAFTSEHLLMRAPPKAFAESSWLPGPYPRAWGIEDVALIQGHMQRSWSPKFNRGTIEDAMLAAAATHQFHPVMDWLGSLVWDGEPRIDRWLTSAFAAADTSYHRAVGAKFLIAAVRRIRSPGCKFDYMLVLEGAQGIGKSSALRNLFSDAWFSDAIPPDLSSRDAAMALLGIWCLEFSEIDHLIRAEVETIKAFLSRSVDRYRPPYGKAYVDRPRQGILVGTTNSDDYLRDISGNRRIWPVKCGHASPNWVEVNREQLWAEAAAREARGEAIWLSDEDAEDDAYAVQTSRMVEDVWTDRIEEWLGSRKSVRIPEVLTEALAVPWERQGKQQQMRVGAVLRRMGWSRSLRRTGEDGKPLRVWFAPGHDPMTEDITGE
jgi:putative DNA primase/helicase